MVAPITSLAGSWRIKLGLSVDRKGNGSAFASIKSSFLCKVVLPSNVLS
jgi:hypothetical protein